MKLVTILAMATLLLACDQRKPAVSDEAFKQFRASWPGMTERCLDDYRYNGILGFHPDDPDCFEMTQPGRWSGLWDTGWEWTSFCPAPVTAKTCGHQPTAWLVFGKRANVPDGLVDGLYRIDFIGRRTKAKGGFGHLNGYDHLIVADRIISLRLLKAEPRT